MTGGGPRIGVYGLGNVLMGDDAIGPYVIEVLLSEYEFPAEVAVRDLGTPGLDLTPYVSGLPCLVLVDAVKAEGAPGTVRTWRRDAILRHPPLPRLSPHDPGVKEALLLADLVGQGPREVLLVGIVPGSVATGTGLTAEARAAVRPAIEAVLGELERLGAPARRRDLPGRPDLWWEGGAASPRP